MVVFVVFDKVGILTTEEEEQYAQARRKMLGNIKFICKFTLFIYVEYNQDTLLCFRSNLLLVASVWCISYTNLNSVPRMFVGTNEIVMFFNIKMGFCV